MSTSGPTRREVRMMVGWGVPYAWIAAILVLIGSCAGPRSGAVDPPLGRAEDPELTLVLTLENDAFTSSDNNYTNGLALTLQTAERRSYAEDSFVRRWIDFWSFLPQIGNDDCQTYATWTLGQEIFTPDDIDDPDPALDDEPYAGVLFLDSTLYARTRGLTHAWNLRLGMVGPSAHAGDVQSGFHRIIGSGQPKGWKTQLPDEPILNVDYTLGTEWLHGNLDESASWRLVPLTGASLGNYFTGASAAMYGEVGWNLPPSVGLLSIRRGVDAFSAEDPGSKHSWSLSFFLGAGGFAVARYLPLDGTLFRDSRSVDSEPWAGFASTGFTWRNKWCTIAGLFTTFGDTFETQRQATEYGTLTLAWTF